MRQDLYLEVKLMFSFARNGFHRLRSSYQDLEVGSGNSRRSCTCKLAWLLARNTLLNRDTLAELESVAANMYLQVLDFAEYEFSFVQGTPYIATAS